MTVTWCTYDQNAAARQAQHAESLDSFKRLFPMAPTRALLAHRAILDRQVIEIRDMANEPELLGAVRDLGHRSNLVVPLLRDGAAIGAIGILSWDPGGFPD